jgi:hypothetical protein
MIKMKGLMLLPSLKCVAQGRYAITSLLLLVLLAPLTSTAQIPIRTTPEGFVLQDLGADIYPQDIIQHPQSGEIFFVTDKVIDQDALQNGSFIGKASENLHINKLKYTNTYPRRFQIYKLQWYRQDTLLGLGHDLKTGDIGLYKFDQQLRLIDYKLIGHPDYQLHSTTGWGMDSLNNLWITGYAYKDSVSDATTIFFIRFNSNLEVLSKRYEPWSGHIQFASDILPYPSGLGAITFTMFSEFGDYGQQGNLQTDAVHMDSSFNVQSADSLILNSYQQTNANWVGDSSYLFGSLFEKHRPSVPVDSQPEFKHEIAIQLIESKTPKDYITFGEDSVRDYPALDVYAKGKSNYYIAGTNRLRVADPLFIGLKEYNPGVVIGSFQKQGDTLEKRWERYLGRGRGNYYVHSLTSANTGGMIVMGTFYGYDTARAERRELFFLKVDSKGQVKRSVGRPNSQAPDQATLKARATPNPSSGRLRLKGNFRGAVTVTLYNAQGQRVCQRHLRGKQGTATLRLPGLASGLYTYRLQDRRSRQTSGRWLKR